MEKNVILLTGDPGVGKSTLACNVIGKLLAEKIVGKEDLFGYTTVRLLDSAGGTEGFEAVTRGGERCVIASTRVQTPHRYRKFFVGLDAFETTLASEFKRAAKHERPIVHIDEIGLMEKASPGYTAALTDFIRNFNAPIIGVIKMVENDDFLDSLIESANVFTYTVTKSNRKALEREVLEKFSAIIEKYERPAR